MPLLKREILLVNDKTRKAVRQIFRYKTIAYVYETSNTPDQIPIQVNLTYHDKKGVITSCKLLFKLLLKLLMLQIKYNQAFKKKIISETF